MRSVVWSVSAAGACTAECIGGWCGWSMEQKRRKGCGHKCLRQNAPRHSAKGATPFKHPNKFHRPASQLNELLLLSDLPMALLSMAILGPIISFLNDKILSTSIQFYLCV